LGWLIIFVFVFNGVSWGGIRWWRANEYWKDFLFALDVYEREQFCNERPALDVIVSRPFYMGKFEVTNEQYAAVMEINQNKFKEYSFPVGGLSWDNAQLFCNKVSEITGSKVRLPTEAEWEYACRAGTTTMFYSGNGVKDLMKVGWFDQNSGGKMHPVGQKQPNAFGLYDMHGNQSEFCQDWSSSYSIFRSRIDPQEIDGCYRPIRGGCFSSRASYCRSASRGSFIENEFFNGGFRVVLQKSGDSLGRL
jgi:formylglycine-generating enzyme required for sulfatase activity